jgi:hypothetical protein
MPIAGRLRLSVSIAIAAVSDLDLSRDKLSESKLPPADPALAAQQSGHHTPIHCVDLSRGTSR